MRIRTIKPEFFTHEELFELEKETGFPIRIAFAGLWCVADREGRFRWEPRRIGVAVLPYDGCDFSRVLDALTTRGFIVKYRVEGVYYGVIPSFTRHQIINNRERPSDYPEPATTEDPDASITRDARVEHAPSVEGKGREQGKEGERKESAFALVVQDWTALPCLLNTSLFKTAWTDYLAYRRERKLPKLAPMSISEKWRECELWGIEESVTNIRASIANNYQGIFPSKTNGRTTDKSNPRNVGHNADLDYSKRTKRPTTPIGPPDAGGGNGAL